MKKSHRPTTKVKNLEPKLGSPDWVIWAAWADRITFEEIEKKTGKTESDVIKIMRRNLKPSSFPFACPFRAAFSSWDSKTSSCHDVVSLCSGKIT